MKRSWLLVLMFAMLSAVGCTAGAAYYAPVPPPPARAEVYGVAPGPGFVWVTGYWGWRGGRYAWEPGRWARPPRPRSVWVPGYWEGHHNRYRYHEGHWR